MNMNLSNRKILIIASLLAVFVAAVFFVSCGGNGDFEKPSTTQTESALISASTLKTWMDEGKVNGTGYDRVVILDVTDSATYAAGHIPGAMFLSSGEIAQDRNEGVGTSSYEVLDGPTMDKLIRKYGIDGRTTVVFTSQTTLFIPSRAYFTFRYWGFPKNRLKVLDGLNPAWNTAYGPLSTELPPVAAVSTYSVTSNRVLRDDLRASLQEMIDYADGKVPNAVAIDARGPGGSYAGVRGSTQAPFGPAGDYTVFEGRIKGAKALSVGTLYTSNVIKPVDQLISAFTNTNVGLDSTKTAYVYCVKGYSSAALFFILDGVLGWPAAIYDGSWTQWGQLSDDATKKGQLIANSPWRTDKGRSENVVYNWDAVPFSAVTSTATQNDLSTGGTFTFTSKSTFVVNIDSTGATDTFSWSCVTPKKTFQGSSIAITAGSPQLLIFGTTVTFASATGHNLNDTWTFTGMAGVEQLTADGNVCSAMYMANGVVVNSNGGDNACTNLPNSFDSDANQVEEADKAYMNSGGGGSSGGSNSVPAGC